MSDGEHCSTPQTVPGALDADDNRLLITGCGAQVSVLRLVLSFSSRSLIIGRSVRECILRLSSYEGKPKRDRDG